MLDDLSGADAATVAAIHADDDLLQMWTDGGELFALACSKAIRAGADKTEQTKLAETALALFQ